MAAIGGAVGALAGTLAEAQKRRRKNRAVVEAEAVRYVPKRDPGAGYVPSHGSHITRLQEYRRGLGQPRPEFGRFPGSPTASYEPPIGRVTPAYRELEELIAMGPEAVKEFGPGGRRGPEWVQTGVEPGRAITEPPEIKAIFDRAAGEVAAGGITEDAALELAKKYPEAAQTPEGARILHDLANTIRDAKGLTPAPDPAQARGPLAAQRAQQQSEGAQKQLKAVQNFQKAKENAIKAASDPLLESAGLGGPARALMDKVSAVSSEEVAPLTGPPFGDMVLREAAQLEARRKQLREAQAAEQAKARLRATMAETQETLQGFKGPDFTQEVSAEEWRAGLERKNEYLAWKAAMRESKKRPEKQASKTPLADWGAAYAKEFPGDPEVQAELGRIRELETAGKLDAKEPHRFRQALRSLVTSLRSTRRATEKEVGLTAQATDKDRRAAAETARDRRVDALKTKFGYWGKRHRDEQGYVESMYKARDKKGDLPEHLKSEAAIHGAARDNAFKEYEAARRLLEFAQGGGQEYEEGTIATEPDGTKRRFENGAWVLIP